MKKFEKSNVAAVRADLSAAFAAVEKKHGIKLSFGTIRFDANSFRSTLSATIFAPINGESFEKTNWNKHCFSFGLSPQQFGQKFVFKGRVFEVSGIKEHGRRFPVIAKEIGSSKSYRFETSALKDNYEAN